MRHPIQSSRNLLQHASCSTTTGLDEAKVRFFQEGIEHFESKEGAESDISELKSELAKASGELERSKLKLQLALYELLKVLSLPPETEITLNDQEPSVSIQEFGDIFRLNHGYKMQ